MQLRQDSVHRHGNHGVGHRTVDPSGQRFGERIQDSESCVRCHQPEQDEMDSRSRCLRYLPCRVAICPLLVLQSSSADPRGSERERPV